MLGGLGIVRVAAAPGVAIVSAGCLDLRKARVEERTAKAIGEPVELTVRARTDVLVTGKQYEAVGDVRLTEEGNSVATPEARAP